MSATTNNGEARFEQDAADDRPFQRLRLANAAMGVVHLVQAIAIWTLSSDFTLPVTTSFREGPPGAAALPPVNLSFEVPLGPIIALFLVLAAIDHLLVAAPGVFPWYVRNLRRGVNYARWYEYSISASVMIVAIALLTGVQDLAALIGIFSINAIMILCGLLMERWNQGADRTDRTDWSAYVVGCLAGIVPWIVAVISLVAAEQQTGGEVPTFVYAIVISLFLFFNSFAVNMWLQYRKVGRWHNYLFGEAAYIVLSLVAKSALAWQVFSGTLAD